MMGRKQSNPPLQKEYGVSTHRILKFLPPNGDGKIGAYQIKAWKK